MTVTVNDTAESIVAARQTFCPLTDNDILNGWSIYDLPAACVPLLNPYCQPNPDAPAPTPSPKFPAVCTPDRSPVTTSASASNAAPSPIEPSTVPTCKQYYKVLPGDTCFSIANNFKVSLDQFNKWNMGVGATCEKLFLGYYVCIAA
ncbi:MAG: hypothetical protein Q9218_002637 [Villophora microphyllina]